MIDTVKIYTMIDKNIYDNIKSKSVIKTSYRTETKEVFYNIVNDHLKGSFDTSLSVRVDSGVKYQFVGNYIIEIEGSYHKIAFGYNSHNGFYNLYDVCYKLIKFVENAYNIILPDIQHWFLQRVDIAICFDLHNQTNVINYLNNLHSCDFPRRHLRNYGDYGGSGIYFSGTTTTLKIYNKYLEFKKHDLKRFRDSDFNIINYLNEIQGFIRFEVEIKKKKLLNLYNNKHIRIRNVNYNDLKKVWCEEFMKLLKIYENDLKIVKSKTNVESRLLSIYGNVKGRRLYNFFLSICVDGIDIVKRRCSKNVFYKNVRELKEASVDFSQKFNINYEEDIVDFNPFEYKEVV